MTAPANSLTERVTQAAASPLATLSASDLRVFLTGLGRLGYNTGQLLAAAGLRDQDLTNPDGRVTCEAYGLVLSRAQQQRVTTNLALELARVTPIGAYPLLDYLVLTADSVGDAVHQLARYFRLTSNPVFMSIRDEADPIRVELTTVVAPFAIEFLAALMHLHLRAETDGRFTATSICLQHGPDDPAAFERVLGCPVNANASWSGLTIAASVWRLPLRRRDPVLRRMLERYANEILEQLPPQGGVASDVQRVLITRVTGGNTKMNAVARQLSMSARTLQRRLAAEGETYQGLLDRARKETASRYLSRSNLAIGEIAYLVGFSEPAPFHRAFKRWFGVTPERFRQQQRGTSAS